MATNVTTGQIDWAPLDRVFAAAARYHQHLIPVLAGESGSCDSGHWADPSWYDGGFMDVFNAGGMTPLSYWDYLRRSSTGTRTHRRSACGNRCRRPKLRHVPPSSNRTTAMATRHVPTSRPRLGRCGTSSTWSEGRSTASDPRHLVEAGLLGSGQCGAVWSDYSYVGASPGIDVLSYHDYGAPNTPIPGDQWNGLGRPHCPGRQPGQADHHRRRRDRRRDRLPLGFPACRRSLRRRPGPARGQRAESCSGTGCPPFRARAATTSRRETPPWAWLPVSRLAEDGSDLTRRSTVAIEPGVYLRGEFPITRPRGRRDLPTIPSCAHRW